jgi:hypothetical protein
LVGWHCCVLRKLRCVPRGLCLAWLVRPLSVSTFAVLISDLLCFVCLSSQATTKPLIAVLVHGGIVELARSVSAFAALRCAFSEIHTCCDFVRRLAAARALLLLLRFCVLPDDAPTRPTSFDSCLLFSLAPAVQHRAAAGRNPRRVVPRCASAVLSSSLTCELACLLACRPFLAPLALFCLRIVLVIGCRVVRPAAGPRCVPVLRIPARVF